MELLCSCLYSSILPITLRITIMYLYHYAKDSDFALIRACQQPGLRAVKLNRYSPFPLFSHIQKLLLHLQFILKRLQSKTPMQLIHLQVTRINYAWHHHMTNEFKQFKRKRRLGFMGKGINIPY